MRILLTLIVGGMAAATSVSPSPAPHCQVPCGIYGDQMRVTMLLEDATTLEKSMKMLAELGAADTPNYNQIVRWVTNKDEHAQKIQQQCLDYWLAQRIKAPSDEAGKAKYLAQLTATHGIIVAAMKCKQTTDLGHVDAIRKNVMALSEAYFSAEDLEHLQEHHQGHK